MQCTSERRQTTDDATARTPSVLSTQYSVLQPLALVFVLHGHLPYARRQGQWPHGEEWIHEAASTTYIPLLIALTDLAERGVPFRLTIGLTPILMEQLADPSVIANMEDLPRRPPRTGGVGSHPLRADWGEPRGARRDCSTPSTSAGRWTHFRRASIATSSAVSPPCTAPAMWN